MDSDGGTPWKILVVDDDEDDFLLIKDIIAVEWKECAEVHWHTDPYSVVEKVCSNQYTASLINSHLKGENILTLIEQISRRCPDQAILFLTDWPDPEIMIEALQKGARSALHKRNLTDQRLTEEIKKVVLDIRQ